MNSNTYNNSIYNISLVLLCALVIPVRGLAQNQQDIQLANEYLTKGENEKALALYTDLAKSADNIPLIHNNYLNVMLDLGKTEDALHYLHKVQRQDPDNVVYDLDEGYTYVRSGDMTKADKLFKSIIDDNKSSIMRIKIISDYLLNRRLIDYGVMALQESRQALGNEYLYCLELAMLYRIQGKRDDMVREYLTYVTQNRGNVQYVKNIMQALLVKPEELESLEHILYEKVQEDPDEEVYSDLLIWVTMQEKNFYASFIQARAYDRRYNTQGEKCMEVAQVALDNNDYATASRIYRYVIGQYPRSDQYLPARLGLVNAREESIKHAYPVRLDSVMTLINDYESLITDYPGMQQTLEAERSEALLYADYADNLPKAIDILQNLINDPKTPAYLEAKAKLDLGDIYLLGNQPWESTLLYSQVEKTQQENPLGYEAKLRNAKLSYYTGDFKLAQEHLDILKEATTREIANDAMALSLLIQENLQYDTLGLALRAYSHVELLQYQHKTDQALKALDDLKNGKEKIASADAASLGLSVSPGQDSTWISFTNGPILDNAYWLEASIRRQRGEFDQAIGLLQKILDQNNDSVLADDAMFTQADIYENDLKDKDKAMELYRTFLTRFPASVYTAEARKRFRILRGDFSNDPTIIN